MDKSLRDILDEILEVYDFTDGPLFNLRPKLRLHSALAYEYSGLEGEDFYKVYLGETVKRACDIFRELDFTGELLLVYDRVFKEESELEEEFIESILLGPWTREEYTYEWFYTEGEGLLKSRRIIYGVEDLRLEELFLQIGLSDFSGDYDLASAVFIIDRASGTIFNLYDDRGLYIMSLREEILEDLWKARPADFFQDCQDFKIDISRLYWIDKRIDNREDLCLHGDLKIRINDKVIEYSPSVSAAGLNLLRSLFRDHKSGEGLQLFPCCGNTLIAKETGDRVDIIGCNEGLDWSIKHGEGLVTIESSRDLKTSYYYLQYKKEVLDFASRIEDFYRQAGDRVIGDEIDRQGYQAFWTEWKALKERASSYL